MIEKAYIEEIEKEVGKTGRYINWKIIQRGTVFENDKHWGMRSNLKIRKHLERREK